MMLNIVCGVLHCRTVTGSLTACGQSAHDRCLLQYENSVSFELPQSPSPQLCVSVIVNNVLRVNMTSPLWCEYILNIGKFKVILHVWFVDTASACNECTFTLHMALLIS